MFSKMHLVLLIAVAVWVGSSAVCAEEHEDRQALVKLVPAAKITLQQGLTASEAHGQAISAKYEADEGKLELSVYTSQAGAFSEVEVDYPTGKVAKAEPITEGEDLAAAKAQVTAMAKAKKPLTAAVEKAEHDFAGYRAISVTPKLQNGHSVAVVALLKGMEFKSVPEALD